MDKTDFTCARQKLLTFKIYHRIFLNHSEKSSDCMLRQGALSRLVFEWHLTTAPPIMQKEDVICIAPVYETSNIVLVFRSINGSSRVKVYPSF